MRYLCPFRVDGHQFAARSFGWRRPGSLLVARVRDRPWRSGRSLTEEISGRDFCVSRVSRAFVFSAVELVGKYSPELF
ncbi:hypothetical protein AM571_CH01188 [Rhizobium etli 8C-3]|uniref:Uncharacterized protein n=1 Tax=Rhizobium etli 8C-3 TaxID=538025 RepID=A0A1L5P1L4_RHIET|nr:hypothetical protein AM571_CH01188 [Rhizobium etli 8C-3]